MEIDEKAHREWIAHLRYDRDNLTKKYSANWYRLNERIEQMENELRYWT